MLKIGYVYIMTNKSYGTLYVGVTSDLVKRIYQHKEGVIDGFTKRYELNTLVCPTIESAIMREKKLKGGNRKQKIELIESINKDWHDLYDIIIG